MRTARFAVRSLKQLRTVCVLATVRADKVGERTLMLRDVRSYAADRTQKSSCSPTRLLLKCTPPKKPGNLHTRTQRYTEVKPKFGFLRQTLWCKGDCLLDRTIEFDRADQAVRGPRVPILEVAAPTPEPCAPAPVRKSQPAAEFVDGSDSKFP
jgi:hypothetical protein